MKPHSRISRCAAVLAACLGLSSAAQAQLTLFGREDFDGFALSLDASSPDLERSTAHRRANSAMVRGPRWEVCEERNFRGHCQVLREGRYPSLLAMGLMEPIRSARPLERHREVDERDYAPLPEALYDARRRRGERLYEAPVSSVRAVLGPPERRCWVERSEVERESRSNLAGGLAGAVIGGIIGHQIGGGTGRDLATIGGVVAGAAIGANVQRDREGRQIVTQDVRRCEAVPGRATPAYWEVIYEFRGIEHRIQTSHPPGDTILVNRRGEPRV